MGISKTPILDVHGQSLPAFFRPDFGPTLRFANLHVATRRKWWRSRAIRPRPTKIGAVSRTTRIAWACHQWREKCRTGIGLSAIEELQTSSASHPKIPSTHGSIFQWVFFLWNHGCRPRSRLDLHCPDVGRKMYCTIWEFKDTV